MKPGIEKHPMKLCQDCKHYGGGIECIWHRGRKNPVDGSTYPDNAVVAADWMRGTLCGWDFPRLWAPKGDSK